MAGHVQSRLEDPPAGRPRLKGRWPRDLCRFEASVGLDDVGSSAHLTLDPPPIWSEDGEVGIWGLAPLRNLVPQRRP